MELYNGFDETKQLRVRMKN